jgi:threonine dehydrogenase-like Zn-dependent dehydrogenase
VTRAYSYFVLAGPGEVACRTMEVGNLEPQHVRVRFLYCGLCGSDMSRFEGRRDVAYPVSIGHEFIAEVVEAGQAVSGLQPGVLVTSDLNYRCGRCSQCRARRSHLCEQGQIGLFSNRGFAEYGDLDASYLLRVHGPARKGLALAEPLSCVLHARDWADPRNGDRVLIVGAGGLGVCMSFALSTRSVPIPFDITDVMPARLAAIDAVISPNGNGVAEVRGKYDIVFDLSGTEAGLLRACDTVRAGGRLCSMSHIEGATAGSFLLRCLTRKDVTFTVSYLNGERDTLRTAADLLARRWAPRWDALLEIVPLADLQGAFERRRRSHWCKTMIAVSG